MFKYCWPLLDIDSSYLVIGNAVITLLHGICPITAHCTPVNSVQHFMQLEWESITILISNRTGLSRGSSLDLCSKALSLNLGQGGGYSD
jgi:hypothetical protein